SDSIFFFSSRRRHTRFSRDWSSDVCSSDLFTCDADNLATINQCIHKHPHELLDSVVKEHFDGTEGLNRGRAFYAANPACQAPAERFFRFSSVAYHRNPDQPDLAAGGESYSVKPHCQPRLDQQPASSGGLLTTQLLIQLIDSQGVFSSVAL